MAQTNAFAGCGSRFASWGDFGGSIRGVIAGGFSVALDGDGNAVVGSCENVGSTLFDEGTTDSVGGSSLEGSSGSYAGGISGFYTKRHGIARDSVVRDPFEQLIIRFDDVFGVDEW